MPRSSEWLLGIRGASFDIEKGFILDYEVKKILTVSPLAMYASKFKTLKACDEIYQKLGVK